MKKSIITSYFLFLAILAIIYIANGHWADKTIRNINANARDLKNMQHEFPLLLHLTIRKIKDGLGKAYIHGFKWALENGYDYIFEMDADFSHNPNDLPKLFDAAQKGDMSIGSRYCKGVNVHLLTLKQLRISGVAQ